MKNVGKITISPALDLVAIAEAAGQSEPEARWYENGVLYVQGVTDEALVVAAEKVNSVGAQAERQRRSRIAEINARFVQIDEAAVRPTRVIAAGLGTEADTTILYFLEVEAEGLRFELQKLKENSEVVEN